MIGDHLGDHRGPVQPHIARAVDDALDACRIRLPQRARARLIEALTEHLTAIGESANSDSNKSRR